MSTPSKFMTLCAWCPGADARTQAATATGYTVSHGICPECKAKLLASLEPEVEPERFTRPSPVRFSCRLTRASLSPVAA